MLRSLLTVLAASFSLPAAALQQPEWEPTFLGGAQASWSSFWVAALDDSGRVAGNTTLDGWKRGWVASTESPPALLPLPPDATWSDVRDMNSAGVIVGQVLLDNGGSRAARWVPGEGGYTFEFLPAVPGGDTPFDARGINDAGEVVGKLGPLSGSYRWTASGGTVQIPSSEFPATPSDINEQRQIVGDDWRLDLDTGVLEQLGSPTGTTYGFMYTVLGDLNDAGECVGYSVVATSGWPYLAVRFSQADEWKLFNSFPVTSANALSIAATGDTVYQLGASFGTYVHVEGFGSVGLASLPGPDFAEWDLGGSFPPVVSRGGRVACTGFNALTGEAGIVLLTPVGFDDLGGATRGSLGDPVLGAYGAPVPGAPVRLRLASAAPNAVALIGWSAAGLPVPVLGGTLHVLPLDALATVQTDPLGKFSTTVHWPSSAVAGDAFTLQAAVVDPAAAVGVALSNGLRGTTR